MAEYRYHFYDVATRAHIDTLPVEDASFTTELRGVGTFSGGVPLYADGLTADRVRQTTIPDRTKVFVERGDTLVWGGRLVPPRRYDSTTGMLTISAEETLGAFAARFLPTMEYKQVDQLTIARDLMLVTQTGPGGDMGLRVASTASPRRRDRSYVAADRTAALTALTDLSEVIDGFEFATQTVWAPDGPSETLLLAYPRLGRVGAAAGLVLEYHQPLEGGAAGGNVDSYTWDDGPGLFTRSWASCDTEEGAKMLASSTNSLLIGQGYPLLEQSQQFEGITNQATLQAHADALSLFAGGHHVTAQFTVFAQPGLELGDWQLGDDVLVRISDWRFPPNAATGAPGFVGYMRIVGVEVTAAPDGEEKYVFTMGDMIEVL